MEEEVQLDTDMVPDAEEENYSDEEPEYDEEGNPIESATQEPEAEAEEPAAEEPEAPVTYYTPPTGETPEMARLREKLSDPDIASDLQAAIDAGIARGISAAMVGQTRLTTVAAERPALWKAYGEAAVQIMASQAPEQRAKAENVEGVLLMAAVGSHIGKPSYGAALARYAALYNGQEAPVAPKKAKEPIPAAQRPPSTAVRAAAPASQGKQGVESLMKRYDLTRAEAEDMLSTVSRPLVATRRSL